MWFLITVGLIILIVVIGVYSYIINDMKRMNKEVRRILNKIDNIEESLGKYYEDVLMPIEKYYNEHFQTNDVHEAEGS